MRSTDVIHGVLGHMESFFLSISWRLYVVPCGYGVCDSKLGMVDVNDLLQFAGEER